MEHATFRAVNQDGFVVDLIGPLADMSQAPARFAPADLVLGEMPNLEWLVNTPAVDVVVIADSGIPVKMNVCDPRAFALHKLWLSKEPSRDPIKKPRDEAQGLLVAQMVLEYLPQYRFEAQQLQFLPRWLRDETARRIEQATDIRLGTR